MAAKKAVKNPTKKRTKEVILERWQDGTVRVFNREGNGTYLAEFTDAADLSQLGIYLPRRDSELKVRVTCEILNKQ